MNHSDASETQAPAASEQPKQPAGIELTINTKPTAEKKAGPECTCPAHPGLKRENTVESVLSDDDVIPVRGRSRRYPRRYSRSPIRIRSTSPRDTVRVNSSAALLEKVGEHDGVVDLPYPSRSSVYVTTFPFTDRDVKKYSWLLSNGVEETWIYETGGAANMYEDSDQYVGPYGGRIINVHRRSRSPYYDPVGSDIPNIFLSRALDKAVVPEDSEKKVKWLIVVQNRSRQQASKLLIAESRKAAGIMIFYEALSGNSVTFVGVVLDERAKRVDGRLRFKKVDDLNEAAGMQQDGEGLTGVVC